MLDSFSLSLVAASQHAHLIYLSWVQRLTRHTSTVFLPGAVVDKEEDERSATTEVSGHSTWAAFRALPLPPANRYDCHDLINASHTLKGFDGQTSEHLG